MSDEEKSSSDSSDDDIATPSKFWAAAAESDDDDDVSSYKEEEDYNEQTMMEVDPFIQEHDSSCKEEEDYNDQTMMEVDPFIQEHDANAFLTAFAGAKIPAVLDARDPDGAWRILSESQVFTKVPTKKEADENGAADCIRIVCMSDTHGKHDQISLPRGDILIHAGDFTREGEVKSIESVSRFFLKHKDNFDQIICIAGNHEETLHPEYYDKNKVATQKKSHVCDDAKLAMKNCTYLEDEACVIGNDVLVYGSPWTPKFCDWAFALERGDESRARWSKTPIETDVLVTHGPPLGRGDLTFQNKHVGCLDLLIDVQDRVKPRLQVFGHIHEGHGCSYDGHTLFVNASNLDLRYRFQNECTVIDLPLDKSKPAQLVLPTQVQISTQGDLLQWFQGNRSTYPNLTPFVLNCSRPSELPIGSQLLSWEVAASQFLGASDDLRLRDDAHRLKVIKEELRQALSQIYSESFRYSLA